MNFSGNFILICVYIVSYSLPCQSWACTWNHDDPNYIYCGLSNGSLMTFDLRQTSTHVNEHNVPNGSCVPVTSLAYVPLCRTSPLKYVQYTRPCFDL